MKETPMRPVVLALAFLPLIAAEMPILTPRPGPEPRINGPRVYGVRPGMPFLYRIPATGARPMKFDAAGLPASIKLDASTGILTGAAPAKPGLYKVTLRASNAHGKASREFRLTVGDTIALTPPMGWNHWYTHYDRVSDKLFREAADAMDSSGMADYGYSYVSIDDCWMMKPGSQDPALSGAPRDEAGRIRPNRRFPDMPALTAYIHAKGLKAGIYTGPGPLTCAQYTAAWQHEERDARTFAEWGFDLLKYDWCSYGRLVKPAVREDFTKPYVLMGGLLKKQSRDIQFNLCQYGMGDVWKWGAEVGGQSWRTTGDLGLEKDTRLPGFYSIAFKNMLLSDYAGPGRWNDPDYILIGTIGNARSMSEQPKQTTLTAWEQYSYMSLWSLMASPLFFSGDMARLDEFTLNVLCNAEVIEINQDPLGRQARVIRKNEDELVMLKPLEDGSVAVGLFNLSEQPRRVAASFADLGIAGRKSVRDVWRQKDLPAAAGEIGAEIERHGVAVYRLR
jgi:alpha-galactosidase